MGLYHVKALYLVLVDVTFNHTLQDFRDHININYQITNWNRASSHLGTDRAASPTRYCEVTPLTLQSGRSIMTHRKLISAFRKHILLKSNFVILQSENNFRTSSSVNTGMSLFLWTLQFNSWCLIVCHFFFDLKSQ